MLDVVCKQTAPPEQSGLAFDLFVKVGPHAGEVCARLDPGALDDRLGCWSPTITSAPRQSPDRWALSAPAEAASGR
jgi:hypothetical protein